MLSVLDMLKVDLVELLQIEAHLARAVAGAAGLAHIPGALDQAMHPQLSAKSRVYVTKLKHVAERVGLTMITLSAERALFILRDPTTLRSVMDALGDLERRFIDQLQGTHVYAVDAPVAGYFAPDDPLFGSVVNSAFPSARFDISEAGKCLALDRHTAAVMHAMRALEPALTALAVTFGVEAGANWNKTLDQVEAAIRNRSTDRSPDEKAWAATVATHFRFVKDAVRNEAMHGRRQYDARGARELVDAAGIFMREVADRLIEPGADHDATVARFVGKVGGAS